MPQVSQRFGPINQNVVLDGSGTGTVSFQATGGNARITNLFVRVSTATAQAKAIVYKGFVANGNQISNTNSGSTGAACHGTIDLLDGETVYVQWTGGDAGATATATFTGYLIPFDVIGASELTWDDPIAAADGSLIYPALKSPNYVAGISGWKVDREGNVEFSNAIIRGQLYVPGSDNSYIQIFSSGGLPTTYLRSADQPGIPSADIYQAIIQNISWHPAGTGSSYQELAISGPAFANGSGAVDYGHADILFTGPSYDGSQNVSLTIQSSGGSLDPSEFDINLQGDVKGMTSLLRLVQQSAQALTSGGNMALTFGAGSHDIFRGSGDSWHSTSVNTSRVTPTVAGVYEVRGNVSMSTAGGGANYTQIAATITKNGTRVDAPVLTRPDPGPAGPSVQCSNLVEVNGTTDYIEIFGQQVNTTASNQTTNGSATFRSTLEVVFKSI